MNQLAICAGGLEIYWSSVIIALGVASCFTLSLGLYTSRGGRAVALWVMLPVAVLLSVVFSRVIHWYCHLEQYAGFLAAMTDFSVGSYCLPGALLGTVLAAKLTGRLGLCDSVPRLLDAVAPGGALCIALIRLSALFDSSCRSKIIITSPALQHLPLASAISSASGATEYRFATFYVQFLLMLLMTALLLRFFFKRGRTPMKGDIDRYGHTARMFLVFYSALELVMDSTRYDSSFFHFTFIKGLNPYAGFISLIQLICAACLIGALVHYSLRSVRVNGLGLGHWLRWLGFLLGLGATGGAEYMVQRHGDWYLGCYAVMTAACALMALTVYSMYRSCREADYDYGAGY